MDKLTIVVNCTDRKSVEPAEKMRIRSLPPGPTTDRFEAWRRRVDGADRGVKLLDLYQGEAWLQAKGLAADARSRGLSVRMLVASAGLGLVDITRIAPSYAATFASGHADSVTHDVKRTGEWWHQLSDLPQTTSLRRVANGPVLLVLSENYARAMDRDLVELANRGGDHLLVGGWRSIEGLPRLAADRDLRQALGGTVSSLSLRMARRWMERRTEAQLFTASDAAKWSRWAHSARRSEIYQRAPMTDGEIVGVIRDLVRNEPNLSATRALRIVRARGIACEQKRFGALFRGAEEVR